MKPIVFTILFILSVCNNLKAQDNWYYTFSFFEGDKRYVYANTANVRNQPGLEYEKTDQLVCGHEVTILKDTEIEEKIDGISGKWLKVSYEKDNVQKEGYLWQGTLSYTQLRRGDVKFVFGIDNYNEKSYQTMGSIKAVKDQMLLDRSVFEICSTATAGGRIIDKHGMEGVSQVLEIMFGGAECGVATCFNYFAWDGQKFTPFARTYYVGDGGVYSYTETLDFPTIGSMNNILIKYIEEATDYDQKANSNDEMNWRYKTEVYKWDGKKLTLQDQNWKPE